MRKALKDQQVGMDARFNYRGTNQTRIETLSDASFALAMTLLVLSSSVPHSFEELRASMRLIVPFGWSITLLSVIWYQHYLFFLKYGLQDTRTVTINTILIFLILVYVYPLKFLTGFLFELFVAIFTQDSTLLFSAYGDFSPANMRFLMIVYGLGAAAIFFVLGWLYKYAYSRKDDLVLTPYELFVTKAQINSNLLMGGIPLLSVLLVIIPFNNPTLSFNLGGFVYFTYPIIMTIYGRKMANKKKKLFPDLT